MIDFYRLAGPVLRLIDGETSHRLAILALKSGLMPNPATVLSDPVLVQQLWGLTFANPVGLAAGFDKNAEAVDRLDRWGFAFLEVGSVTPRPQPGNPRPRLFRLAADEAVINRMGFNNHGLDVIAACAPGGARLSWASTWVSTRTAMMPLPITAKAYSAWPRWPIIWSSMCLHPIRRDCAPCRDESLCTPY